MFSFPGGGNCSHMPFRSVRPWNVKVLGLSIAGSEVKFEITCSTETVQVVITGFSD